MFFFYITDLLLCLKFTSNFIKFLVVQALGSTHLLTEMSTRNLPASKGLPARKADNLTAICEPSVQKMWKLRRLTNQWASTACYSASFTCLPLHKIFLPTQIIINLNIFRFYIHLTK
jgi:hypothetical protein